MHRRWRRLQRIYGIWLHTHKGGGWRTRSAILPVLSAILSLSKIMYSAMRRNPQAPAVKKE